MKLRFCAALLLAALVFTVFSGCAAAQKLDTMEDAVEHRLDMAEDALEQKVESALAETPVPMASAPAPTSAPAIPAAKLTKEEAIAIALKDAGLTESQVTRLKAELDYDRGQAEYEVDFHYDRWEYDYEIDAETGKIISFDKDFDD